MPDHPILFASYSGLLGGAERVLLDAVTRMDRAVLVACPPGPLATALGDRHVAVSERTLRTGLAHAAGLAGLTRELERLVAVHRPAALVAWGARAVLAAVLIRRPPPWLAVHHDLLSGAVRAVVRAGSARADGIATASHAIARDLGGGTGITVLHPGVDLDAFTPRPLPDGPPHALVLGALVGWKRPDLALEIAARVPGLHLTLAGAPLPGEPEDPALRRRAAAPDLAGRVTFAGAVTDVPAALAGAHVLLHCADAEPYGLALVEALAAGRPVVAPAAGGPLEIVRDGAGRLYAPGDAAAGARALQEALSDTGDAARRRAETAFDVRDSTQRLERAIEAVLGR